MQLRICYQVPVNFSYHTPAFVSASCFDLVKHIIWLMDEKSRPFASICHRRIYLDSYVTMLGMGYNMTNYEFSAEIIHRDGNPMNCESSNLYVPLNPSSSRPAEVCIMISPAKGYNIGILISEEYAEIVKERQWKLSGGEIVGDGIFDRKMTIQQVVVSLIIGRIVDHADISFINGNKYHITWANMQIKYDPLFVIKFAERRRIDNTIAYNINQIYGYIGEDSWNSRYYHSSISRHIAQMDSFGQRLAPEARSKCHQQCNGSCITYAKIEGCLDNDTCNRVQKHTKRMFRIMDIIGAVRPDIIKPIAVIIAQYQIDDAREEREGSSRGTSEGMEMIELPVLAMDNIYELMIDMKHRLTPAEYGEIKDEYLRLVYDLLVIFDRSTNREPADVIANIVPNNPNKIQLLDSQEKELVLKFKLRDDEDDEIPWIQDLSEYRHRSLLYILKKFIEAGIYDDNGGYSSLLADEVICIINILECRE